MNLIAIIVIIILAYILNFFNKRYVKLSMVIHTIVFLGLIVVADSGIFIAIATAQMFWEISIILKLIIIIISILPILFLKGYIAHTIRILDFCINRNKILESEYIKKGIIQEIKSYGFSRYSKDGYYLIVNFNGEKIKSISFRYHQGGTVVKTTYKSVYSNGKINKERIEEVLYDMPQLYHVGDEIDVIIYNNKKYVKLKDYEVNNSFD